MQPLMGVALQAEYKDMLAHDELMACGIFAHGFARVRCDDCRVDFLVAFSCKGRGGCPSFNTLPNLVPSLFAMKGTAAIGAMPKLATI